MDKNDLLEIYDEDYTKGYEYKDQLKISVNKGVDFLLNNQFNYGEFKTAIALYLKLVVKSWKRPNDVNTQDSIFESVRKSFKFIFEGNIEGWL